MSGNQMKAFSLQGTSCGVYKSEAFCIEAALLTTQSYCAEERRTRLHSPQHDDGRQTTQIVSFPESASKEPHSCGDVQLGLLEGVARGNAAWLEAGMSFLVC
ncbi:hypothetical protein GOP47_0010753 [Adiantum capillus-veneris]|uniref:Uncharacterized protein n=1 Tax=Adiantum capillus-veneris TaxID=13818 RepID=A0A9D4UVX3_ADICA|nr:hypothetical protein GOP47_0010753 [Adiantum capillus-veneris]